MMSEESVQNEAQPGSEAEVLQQRIEELQRQLDEAQRSADTNKDMLLRKAAEFENYKKRNAADFANDIKNANAGLMTALLPVISDLLRSLKSGAEQKDYDSFYKGIELIHAKLMKVLESRGLQSFESVGKPFDVGYHDALLQVPNPDVPPNTVLEEVERGYKLHDRVLQHAKVIVSSTPVEQEAEQSGDKDGTN